MEKKGKCFQFSSYFRALGEALTTSPHWLTRNKTLYRKENMLGQCRNYIPIKAFYRGKRYPDAYSWSVPPKAKSCTQFQCHQFFTIYLPSSRLLLRPGRNYEVINKLTAATSSTDAEASQALMGGKIWRWADKKQKDNQFLGPEIVPSPMHVHKTSTEIKETCVISSEFVPRVLLQGSTCSTRTQAMIVFSDGKSYKAFPPNKKK